MNRKDLRAILFVTCTARAIHISYAFRTISIVFLWFFLCSCARWMWIRQLVLIAWYRMYELLGLIDVSEMWPMWRFLRSIIQVTKTKIAATIRTNIVFCWCRRLPRSRNMHARMNRVSKAQNLSNACTPVRASPPYKGIFSNRLCESSFDTNPNLCSHWNDSVWSIESERVSMSLNVDRNKKSQ